MTTANNWIFKSFSKDFLALWGLALLLFFVFHPAFVSAAGMWILVAALLIIVDSGHAYATLFRTYFDKEVMKNSPQFYWIPIGCFLGMFVWAFLGLPYFWTFVIYFTFYHNVKQHFGITAWYAKLNNCKLKELKFFLYVFTIMPFVSFHFRDFDYTSIYAPNEIFFYQNESIFNSLVFLNFALLNLFIAYSAIHFSKNRMNLPVFCSVFFPGALSFLCLNFGANMEQALVPLLVIHGFAYFCLTAFVIEKKPNNKYELYKLILLVLFVAGAFGALESALSESFVDYLDSENYRGKFLFSVAASFIVMPSLSHYIIDGIIWKKTYPEFSKALTS